MSSEVVEKLSSVHKEYLLWTASVAIGDRLNLN